MPHRTLERRTFRISRSLDFLSEKELVAQSGHGVRDWPLVILKELVDNALDACEDAAIAPEITVAVDSTGIAVADNGPGIPSSTVEGVLDFASRTSSREAYVSPTRGAQGNALKTVLAMPFVLSGGQEGSVSIEAPGIHHEITIRVDQIVGEPVIRHQPVPGDFVKNGTRVTVPWPDSPRLSAGMDADFSETVDDSGPTEGALPWLLWQCRERFLQIAADYVWLNPHLTLTVDWDGDRQVFTATDPCWRKWRSNQPTSAHWYTEERFARLVAATIAYDRERNTSNRLIRQFIAEFDGLSGSRKQKAVLDATGCARAPLAALVNGGGDGLDDDGVRQLLTAMKDATKPVKARRLGFIGETHLRTRFEAAGCDMGTFKYWKQVDDAPTKPEVVEMAFGYCPSEDRSRRFVTGVNWSPGLNDPFRRLGETGESLSVLLQRRKVEYHDPVIFVVHYACPRVEYTDRGKSAIALDWNG